jgi:hypothetical protein
LLEVKTNAKGNLTRPRAPYCLKPAERNEILKWLKKLKFSDRYAANITRAVNIGIGKLNGLKSHDYHIIMERLLPVMLRGYVDTDLWKMFVELSYFYRQLYAKQVSKMMMQKFEKEISILVCKIKKIFSPGWFNAMQYLLVHLPWEAKVGGPVQFRWMNSQERELKKLRATVRLISIYVKKVDESPSSSRSQSDMTSSLFQVIVSFNFHLLFSLLFTIFTHIFCFQGTSLRGRQREALIGVLTAPEQAAPEQPPPPADG